MAQGAIEGIGVNALSKQRQPTFPPGQHSGNQFGEPLSAAIEVAEQRLHVAIPLANPVVEQRARRQFVERHGIGSQVAERSAAAGHRRTHGQPRTEGVDRDDAQARRIFGQIPTAPPRLLKHAPRQPEAQLAVRRHFAALGFRFPQASGNALAHLGCRLAGKGDRQHGVGFRLLAEKAQVALDQNLGLARAGGRLHDE